MPQPTEPPPSWTQQPYGQQPAYGRAPTAPQQPAGWAPPPGYGQRPPAAPGPAPARRNRTPVIALVVAGVLVVAGIGVALWFGLRDREIPAATQQPTGLGTDPALDAYAQDCYAGDMGACDSLWEQSPVGSAYETYGGTCAGRQPEADSDSVFCARAFG